MKVVRNALPVSEVLNNESFPDSLKVKISLIQTVKCFDVEELDLSTSDNYSSFYDEESNVTLWNVYACMPYALEAKTWWFPIVGDASY